MVQVMVQNDTKWYCMIQNGVSVYIVHCIHTHVFIFLFRFHAGSIAFGSLIIAVVQLLRVILAYIQKKLKGKSGKIVDALLCMLQCCLWCFEKILRYINRQAYIEVSFII